MLKNINLILITGIPGEQKNRIMVGDDKAAEHDAACSSMQRFQDDHQLNVEAPYPVALFNPEVVMVFRYIIRSIQIINLALSKE